MKQTIKYLILALLIPAAYCFTACDTDIEPIDQQIIKPDQQDPAQYAAYLAALKAYKASEHYVVYASLANAPAVPGSEKAFLRSLPDSLDIVALENAGNLTEYDIEDIPQAQAKGTKILYTVDYNTLAESTDAAALGTYLDKVIEVVNRYKFDGVTVRYGGAMDAAATQAAATIVSKLSSLTGKILMAEGNPLFIAKENHSAVTYFVLTTTDAVNTFNIRSQLAYATDYAGIPLEKIIITAEPGGKLTDENLVQQPAIAEAAKSVITMGPLAGLGIYNIGDDYYDAYINYKQTKHAIGLLNPANPK